MDHSSLAMPAFAVTSSKRAVASIPVQNVVPHPRDEQIRVAVVVEIRDGGSHRIARPLKPRLGRDIHKLQPASVAEQTIPISRSVLL